VGALSFVTETVVAREKTAKDAFQIARSDAQYEYGNRGYTGTIAEKSAFVMLPIMEGKTAEQSAWEYLRGDDRVDDKWGPCGCIKTVSDKYPDLDKYVFFGWASA